MDVKNSLALKKKRELLGSVNKRKMSLRKYMDNLKQDECRLDITQITKCVFLASLCLKPVPQLFDSPILLEELDMKVGNVSGRVPVNDENVSRPDETIMKEKTVKNDYPKKANNKKKNLNTPKIKKKSLREKNESKNIYNSLNNVKNENVKLEINESLSLEDAKLSLTESRDEEINEIDSPPEFTDRTIQQEIVFCKIVEPTFDETIVIEKPNDLQSNTLEEEVLDFQLNETNSTEEVIPNVNESNSMPLDIKTNFISTDNQYEDNINLKRELTPELILSDSDDDAIDQLMYNIMDIKIGPNGFEEKLFDLPPSDIQEYKEYSNDHFNEKVTSSTVDGEATKDKKFIKRTPQCKICSQVFPTHIKLKKHKIAHNGDKPYLCLKCGENHATLEQLIAHLRTHQGKRPYVCKKCNKGFKTIKALENHQPVHVLRQVIPPKKTFKCEVCGKEFRKLCDLERHTRVHTGEKPSVCNICNKRFQQAHNLNKHLLIHTQEKPFQCDICNKKFGRNDVLNRHLLTHSVKKPNHCETCMKSFIRVSQLLAHKEKYHA
ncbi:zinc finger protein 391-like [Asbolus verrucosus]|uniref:Zinc finger protein 391-like n=1 Tax=Asbolus verrucosus TaxID=1661398 RepID=A0A482VQT6_ASBVE|nr:zinc finger protein 391-like [Asbolus verrucosus]